MRKNEEKEKERAKKLRPRIKKSENPKFQGTKLSLKIEISHLHSVGDDIIAKEGSKREFQKPESKTEPKKAIQQDQNSPNENNPFLLNSVQPATLKEPKDLNPPQSDIMNDNSRDTIIYHSVKELTHISHFGQSEKITSTFAGQVKKPYWPENLWKGGTLIYSHENPEKCLGPPLTKSDKTLRFNSRFESGNLMYVYRLSPDSYHCILESDHTCSGQCQWFYFQMTNVRTNSNANRKTTFYISGFKKSNGVFSTGSKVFMYSEKNAISRKVSWFRAGTNYAYGSSFKKSAKKGDKKNKNKRFTLQFQIAFPYDDDVVYFCYAIPYTYTDLNRSILNWYRIAPRFLTKRILCKTYGGKDCPLLTITADNSLVKKRCIFITSRIHPGESNGSIVLCGLIDFMLTKQPITTYLLENFVFQIVPMINIDGVIEGYYRVGLEGDDLNRVWSNPDEKKHPVVFYTKKLMRKMHEELGIAAYLDFHGHSRQHGTFAYGCPWDPNENLPSSFIDKEKNFPKMLAFLCDAFSFDKCVFSVPPERKDASRCVLRRELGIVNSFTIESSFGGIVGGPRNSTLYNEQIWKEIGAKVVEALFHLLLSDDSPLNKLVESTATISYSNEKILSKLPSFNHSKAAAVPDSSSAKETKEKIDAAIVSPRKNEQKTKVIDHSKAAPLSKNGEKTKSDESKSVSLNKVDEESKIVDSKSPLNKNNEKSKNADSKPAPTNNNEESKSADSHPASFNKNDEEIKIADSKKASLSNNDENPINENANANQNSSPTERKASNIDEKVNSVSNDSDSISLHIENDFESISFESDSFSSPNNFEIKEEIVESDFSKDDVYGSNSFADVNPKLVLNFDKEEIINPLTFKKDLYHLNEMLSKEIKNQEKSRVSPSYKRIRNHANSNRNKIQKSGTNDHSKNIIPANFKVTDIKSINKTKSRSKSTSKSLVLNSNNNEFNFKLISKASLNSNHRQKSSNKVNESNLIKNKGYGNNLAKSAVISSKASTKNKVIKVSKAIRVIKGPKNVKHKPDK